MIAMLAAAAFAAPAGFEAVQRLDLTDAFRTRTPWAMTLLQPIGANAEIGGKAAQVCLTGGREAATRCEDLAADGYVFQTIRGAAMEPLSAKAALKGVSVKAESSGGARVLRRTDVWTYRAASDDFERTSGFSRSDLGEEERFAAGALDGLYIVADFLMGADETRRSDHRYSIEIYTLAPRFGGYVQAFQYLSPSAYPSKRRGPHEVIDRELTRARKLLSAAYPNGLAQLGKAPPAH
jgi:hypothetical protein